MLIVHLQDSNDRKKMKMAKIIGKRHSSPTWFYKNCYNNQLSGTGDSYAVMNRAEGLGQVTFPLALWKKCPAVLTIAWLMLLFDSKGDLGF